MRDRDGLQRRFVYDRHGRLESAERAAERLRFDYDELGNLSRVTSNRSSYSEYSYDAFGRLARVGIHHAGSRYVRYDYDPWGTLLRVSVLDSRERPLYALSFTHDLWGRVTSVADVDGTVTYSYAPQRGEVNRTLPDGTHSTFQTLEGGSRWLVKHFPEAGGTPNENYEYEYTPADDTLTIRSLDASETVRELSASDAGQARLTRYLERYAAPFADANSDIVFNDGNGLLAATDPSRPSVAYFTAPLGNGGILIGECHDNIGVYRVVAITDALVLERTTNPGTKYRLEAPQDAWPLPSSKPAAQPFRPLQSSALAIRSLAAAIPFLPTLVVRNPWQELVLRSTEYVGVNLQRSRPTEEGAVSDNIGNAVSAARGKPVDVFLTGVSGRPEESREAARKYFPNSTAVGIPVNTGTVPVGSWNLANLGDAIWAAADQTLSGRITKTDERLLGRLLQVGNIGTLAVHSHGGITLGNLHEQVDDAIGDGRLSVQKVMFLGVNPDRRLTDMLDRRGVPWSVRADQRDPIRIVTTPTGELITFFEERAPWLRTLPFDRPLVSVGVTVLKGLALLGAAANANDWVEHVLPGANALSFKSHGLDNYSGGNWQPGLVQPSRLIASASNAVAAPATLFKQIRETLGGIDLSVTPGFSDNIGHITGAVWDDTSQRLVLLGDGDSSAPPIRLDYLAVALYSVFGPRPFDPQFSLDPLDERDPDGPVYRAVYIPDELRTTSFGGAMFEADWLLKQYGFGLRLEYGDFLPKETDPKTIEGHAQRWASGRFRPFLPKERLTTIEGLTDMSELSAREMELGEAAFEVRRKPTPCTMEERCDDEPRPVSHRRCVVPPPPTFARQTVGGKINPGVPRTRRARLWLYVDKVCLRAIPGAIAFESVGIGVQAKQQMVGRDGKLADVETDDPVANEFARLFSGYYDKIAAEEPAFADLKEMAKAVALAKWLKNQQTPVDMAWVQEQLNDSQDSVSLVTRLGIVRKTTSREPYSNGNENGVITRESSITLSGGVDGSVNPTMLADRSGEAAHLRDQVRRALSGNPGPAFGIDLPAGQGQAIVLPLTPAGRAMWDDDRSFNKEGVRYEIDAAKRITAATEKSGLRMEFSWQDKSLASLKMLSPNGTQVSAAIDATGSTLTVVSPSKHKIEYRHDLNSVLREVRVDDSPYATVQHDAQRNQVTVHYVETGFDEVMEYDSEERLTHYERKRAGREIGNAKIAYGREGQIYIDGGPDGTMTVTVSDVGVTSLDTPGSRWRYSYDDDGRLRSATDGAGTSLQIERKGIESIATWRTADGKVDVSFDHVGPTSVGGPGPSWVRYDYNSNGQLEQLHYRPRRRGKTAVEKPPVAPVEEPYRVAIEYASSSAAPTTTDSVPRHLYVESEAAP